jgi:6-pyruvoyltetrahydropterin/6-carboxytetrahydropterin synthase
MKYRTTKTFGNELGLSCCFRQWRATHSHCSQLHGYAIGVRVIIESDILDDRNWVYDFGGFKKFKEWLVDTFDHKTVVAKDDPLISTFRELHLFGLIDLVEVEHVGCEKFAKMCFDKMAELIENNPDFDTRDVYVHSVEVFEHGANSATYTR